MNPVKIVFFDIDGTLIDIGNKQISEKTLETLRLLRQNGILICLATGRSPVGLPKFEGIEFDAYLTFNGSLCYTKSTTIFSNPIPSEDVQQLIGNASALGRPVSVAARDRLAANGEDEDLADYYTLAHLVLEVSQDFNAVAEGEIYQVMLGCRETDYPAILKGTRGVKITSSWDRAADVIPVNSGKGTGVQHILAHFGFSSSEALAFGDGNNDIEMLQMVGTGVAMGNASPRLKAIADDVCGKDADDGIYHYCVRHGLIPEISCV